MADEKVEPHFHSLQPVVRLNPDICESMGLKEVGGGLQLKVCFPDDWITFQGFLPQVPPPQVWLLIWYIKAVVQFLCVESVVSKIGQSEVGPPFLWLLATQEAPTKVP